MTIFCDSSTIYPSTDLPGTYITQKYVLFESRFENYSRWRCLPMKTSVYVQFIPEKWWDSQTTFEDNLQTAIETKKRKRMNSPRYNRHTILKTTRNNNKSSRWRPYKKRFNCDLQVPEDQNQEMWTYRIKTIKLRKNWEIYKNLGNLQKFGKLGERSIRTWGQWKRTIGVHSFCT